jgi:histidinol phosphatase-like enzyme (inositol monophosphatase family)
VSRPAGHDDDLALAVSLAEAARPIALSHFRTDTKALGKPGMEFDPVTEADRGVEAELRARLAEARPLDGVLGEEDAATPSRSGRTWVIDPIDGTRAFIAGLPTWCVLIALVDESGPVLSVIDQPFTGERFTGIADEAAWLDHKGACTQLRTRTCRALRDAMFSTTDPGLFSGAETSAVMSVAGASKVRRYGLDAYAYAALALGGIDIVVESGLKAWDVSALIPVVTGAGGVITDWAGLACHGGGQVLAAATPELHAEALALLKPAAARPA